MDMDIEREVFLGMRAVIASDSMKSVIERARRAAPYSASVLITGETGSGKEIVARAIHHFSLRCTKPWVDINCAAMPEQLMESELFGHERGAFSGADCAKPGLFELAHTGTLFLDEVAELDPRMQVKLLRVLDGAPFYRLGGQHKKSVDVRVVAATNRNLDRGVALGEFRADLYHRLNECQIRVPPLRERIADIVPLAEYFLAQQSEQASLSEEARSALVRHDWPGNIRELRNVVINAAISATRYEIAAGDLAISPHRARPAVAADHSLRLEDMEREAIVAALEKTDGHHQRAANLLGISRRTLSRKLKTFSLETMEEPVR